MERVEYKSEMGDIALTNEMIATLKALPFEEQEKLFAVELHETSASYSYGECDGKSESSSVMPVERSGSARKWIVKDGIIVGMVFGNYSGKDAFCMLNEWCCTYFTVDDDGVGSSEADDYSRLIWVGKK